MDKGIDYSMGMANFDRETGIHYGAISQYSIMMEAMEDFEYIYDGPNCPKCGEDVESIPDNIEDFEGYEEAEHEMAEYVCHKCKYVFGSESAYAEESSGFKYEQDGYILTDLLDTDIFVLRSPYYTYTQFCSPCVPGAGNLDNPMPDGVKTYALGHDWFENGRVPYPLYDVKTGEEVLPE